MLASLGPPDHALEARELKVLYHLHGRQALLAMYNVISERLRLAQRVRVCDDGVVRGEQLVDIAIPRVLMTGQEAAQLSRRVALLDIGVFALGGERDRLQLLVSLAR